MFRTLALVTTTLALSCAAAGAQDAAKEAPVDPALINQQEQSQGLPSIAEEAAESGGATSGPDGEERMMDEMESAENQDGCTPDDDPAVCDGELLD